MHTVNKKLLAWTRTETHSNPYSFKTLKESSFKLTNTSSARSGIQPMSFLKCIKSAYIKAKTHEPNMTVLKCIMQTKNKDST